MVTRTDYTLEGALEMERLLKELGPKVAGRVGDKALKAGAKPIVDEAKRLVPVRTGQLRDSITAQTQASGRPEDKRVVLIGFKKPTSRRAHLTEFGTSHSAAHPFIRPAMDSKAGAALDEMGRVLAQGITQEAEKLAKS